MNLQIKTVLLTGATGFLGSHVLESLIQNGYRTVIIKRSFSSMVKISGFADRAKSYDIDKQDLEDVFKENEIDAVVHVATKYARDSILMWNVVESNVLFGVQILDLCQKYGVKLFINSDTFSNNGDTNQEYLSSYLLSKKQFSEWLFLKKAKYKIAHCILQHVYGPRDDVSKFIPWVISQLVKKESYIDFSPGMQKRDFIFVGDVVSAYMAIIKNYNDLEPVNTFNIGTGVKITLKDMLHELKRSAKHFMKIESEYRFGKLDYRRGEMLDVVSDISNILKLGWKPSVEMEMGLKKTICYYLKNN